MQKLSAYIISKNQEKHIDKCLESILWTDEIVVVDDFSTDRTAEVAKNLGCRVISHSFKNFGDQRNFALSQTSYEWVLCLDCDERVTQDLKIEIQKELSGIPRAFAFCAPRKSKFINTWILHSGWYPDYRHPILFNKSKMHYKEQKVHEDIDYCGKKFYFSGQILHYPYESIKQYVKKSELYANLSAKSMFDRGKRFKILNLFVNPTTMFIKMFVIKKGFLDGLAGLVLALLYAFFYTQMKYIKLWELENKNYEQNKL
ncbi:MAG: glycosyltransferase family 2 protein [Elusimicrobiota bacterium]|jgi:glycosyltransferase involved in cell wall biosynthesis|nr:glycosyltransferase family 2 protein [Elusimicrobiota bacterium]